MIVSYNAKLFDADVTFGNRFDPFHVLRDVKSRFSKRGSEGWAKGSWSTKLPDTGKARLCIMAAVLQAMLEQMKGSNIEEGNFGIFESAGGQSAAVSPVVSQVLFDALLTQRKYLQWIGLPLNLSPEDTLAKWRTRKYGVSAKSEVYESKPNKNDQVAELIAFNDGPANFEDIQALIDDAIGLVKCDDGATDACSTGSSC